MRARYEPEPHTERKMKLFDEIPRLENDSVLLRRAEQSDAPQLERMINNSIVYRYLPTFLSEKQFGDVRDAIDGFYGELYTSKESLILAVVAKESGEFCGLAEFYGYKESLQKTCIGYRLDSGYWGRGIATQAVELMISYLYGRTDTQIITASTMIENKASARVLEKNGFIMTEAAVPEDWGYPAPTIADKWFR